jgi:serpin B
MNRAFHAAAAIALMTACGGRGSAPAADAGAPLEEAHSSLSRQTSPEVGPGDLQSAVAGNNAFAFDLHARLVEPGRNSMTSPFSISSALAMLWAGARGETASQLASALHFSLPQERFHPAFNALDLALQKPWDCSGECSPFTLRITNAVWAQRDYPFAPAYLDTLGASYGAGLNLLDFIGAPEAARLAINDAVARATEDRIRDPLESGSINSLTRLVLTNAVYFKANWVHAFDSKLTAPGSFRLLDGVLASAPFMNGSVETRGVAGASYDAVELPYRDSHFAMTLVAPKSGFEAFESTFDARTLESLDAAMQPSLVVLSMPKFKFEWKKGLVEVLRTMGMADAFDCDRADFAGICAAARLSVSNVMHQTFIAVDEAGTEAAAATAVKLGRITSVPPSQIAVSFDRPFLFFIRDLTTRQIVFLGRVVDPR